MQQSVAGSPTHRYACCTHTQHACIQQPTSASLQAPLSLHTAITLRTTLESTLFNHDALRTVCSMWGAGPEVLADWLDKLALSGGRKAVVAGNSATPCAVTISTIHGAKGLEWDAVFVMRCNDGVLPSTFRDDGRGQVLLCVGGVTGCEAPPHRRKNTQTHEDAAYAAHMQEEQRLAHVACTRCVLSTFSKKRGHALHTTPQSRARERLYLTYIRRGMRKSPLLHDIETLNDGAPTPVVSIRIEPTPDAASSRGPARGRFGIVPPTGPPATGFVSARALLAGEN